MAADLGLVCAERDGAHAAPRLQFTEHRQENDGEPFGSMPACSSFGSTPSGTNCNRPDTGR